MKLACADRGNAERASCESRPKTCWSALSVAAATTTCLIFEKSCRVPTIDKRAQSLTLRLSEGCRENCG